MIHYNTKRFLVYFRSVGPGPVISTSYEVEAKNFDDAEYRAINNLRLDIPGELPDMEIYCRALDGSRRG